MFTGLHFFQHYSNPEMYQKSGVRYCEPMTATEVIGGENTPLLSDNSYYVEEKFDGTRATLHLCSSAPVMVKYFESSGNISVILDFVVNIALGVKTRASLLEWYDSSYKNCTSSELAQKIYEEVDTFLNTQPNKSFYYDYQGKECFIRCSENGIGCEFDDKRTTIFLWQAVANCVKELIDLGGFYPQLTYARCFSRRVSKKTGWFCENTDSVPQLRDLEFPIELEGTVIDGEIFIPNMPFKDASGTLNCNWKEAVDRQLNKYGKFLVIHAFDILYYKGVKVENMPLHRRKEYLKKVCKSLNSSYVVCVPYYPANSVPMIGISNSYFAKLHNERNNYPELYNFYKDNYSGGKADAKVYYQNIVFNGGEGVILKDPKGKYLHKRGREYQKVKKFLTRDVIIMGFEKPTKEYNGKFPNDHWDYWVDSNDNKVSLNIGKENSASDLLEKGFKPVTKFYYEDWVGEIRFGVVITPEEEKKLPKNKKFNIEDVFVGSECVRVIEVGQCSGFDEETRYLFTCNAYDFEDNPVVTDEYQIEALNLRHLDWVGTVIEVKAQEVFKDTGKLRHPRFMRIREDKSFNQCTYADHIG